MVDFINLRPHHFLAGDNSFHAGSEPLAIVAVQVDLHQFLGVSHFDAAGADGGDGLQVLGAHDGPESTTPVDGVAGNSNNRLDDLVFSGRADAGYLDIFTQLFPKRRAGVAGGLAPQVAGISDFNLAVIDPQVDRS